MTQITQAIKQLEAGRLDPILTELYTEKGVAPQRARYVQALQEFAALYGEREVALFSAPGRTEIVGNHTDHNRGRVLAASVNLDVIVVAAKSPEPVVRLQSKGHDANRVELSRLTPVPEEEGTSNSLIRGICARFSQLGHPVGGFDAYTTSDVLRGSGLSSSAAFEVAVGTVLNDFFAANAFSAVEIAQIGQYAENVFFGKPCGLMDQTACSVGSFVAIDFADSDAPAIRSVAFDFASCGYDLCIVNTGGSHADLTQDYAAVPAEMKQAAAFFGAQVLRDVEEEEFWSRLGELRAAVSDRAVLRAVHFMEENRRAALAADMLEAGDFSSFKQLLIESGRSSFLYNQNVYAPKNPEEQGLSVALALAEHLLRGRGAYRVHGGGFAGTIQAFVPAYLTPEFSAQMDAVFGPGACQALSIRPRGGCRVL